jgi:hypothetical protein
MSFSRALILALTFSAPVLTAQTEQRIVAIGDIHGAYDEFVSILAHAKLIDHAQNWTGGRTTLVQTGDFTPGARRAAHGRTRHRPCRQP